MKIADAINRGLYEHIKDGAKTTEKRTPLSTGTIIRTLHIADNNQSYELALA